MDGQARRERVKAIVREQDRVRSELERLSTRSAALDAELDRLLGGGAVRRKVGRPPGTTRKLVTDGETQVRRGRATGKKPKRGQRGRRPRVVGKREPAAAGGAKNGKKVVKEAGPSIKDKLLGVLEQVPGGVDVNVITRRIYGKDDAKSRARCESYLYQLSRRNFVVHDGPKWRLRRAASARA